jgi:hypothetical protein
MLLAVTPILLYAGLAHAAYATGHVLYVGNYGNGNLFISLDVTINEPGCPASRIDIPASHPNIKSFLATALTAKASGQTVTVLTKGCFSFSAVGNNYSFPTVDQSNDSYILLSS